MIENCTELSGLDWWSCQTTNWESVLSILAVSVAVTLVIFIAIQTWEMRKSTRLERTPFIIPRQRVDKDTFYITSIQNIGNVSAKDIHVEIKKKGEKPFTKINIFGLTPMQPFPIDEIEFKKGDIVKITGKIKDVAGYAHKVCDEYKIEQLIEEYTPSTFKEPNKTD